MLIKILERFFVVVNTDKVMKKFLWKCKEIRIAKIILKINKMKELHYLVLKFTVSLQHLRQ
jgi:hypothetical protein